MWWQRFRERTEFDYAFYILITLVAVGVIIGGIAGLIEWNARRQAAAIAREMLKPVATADTVRQAALDQQRLAELRELKRRLAARPLSSDERCVGNTRMRRVENGWRQVNEDCP